MRLCRAEKGKVGLKIATYNIWNEESMNRRFDSLVHEINIVDADIIGLQEVTTFFYETYLAQNANYPFHWSLSVFLVQISMLIADLRQVIIMEWLHR